MVAPVWLNSLKKKNKLKKITVAGYEADLENTEKILPPAPQKSKPVKVISEQETSDATKSNETDDNLC